MRGTSFLALASDVFELTRFRFAMTLSFAFFALPQKQKWPKAISGPEPLLIPQEGGHVARECFTSIPNFFVCQALTAHQSSLLLILAKQLHHHRVVILSEA